jgi:hypothetical protein
MKGLSMTQVKFLKKIKGKGALVLATVSLLFIFGCDMAPPVVKFSPPESYEGEIICKNVPQKKQPCVDVLNENSD